MIRFRDLPAGLRWLRWVGVVSLFGIVEKITHEPRLWIAQLTPMSLFRLDLNTWIGLLLTFAGSLVAWVIGLAVGWALGIGVAALTVEEVAQKDIKALAYHIDNLFDALWVVPLVLTLGLASGFGLYLQTELGLKSWIVAIGLLGISGVVLGGYGVYKSIYAATTSAKQDSLLLTQSLFFRPRGKTQSRAARRVRLVVSLRDCEINSFCEALPRAFHLAIVAVMILEVVVPYFYERIFPSSGAVQAWASGAGYQVLHGQQQVQIQTIAGVIWAVFIFDRLAVALLDEVIELRWLRHYRGRQ
jgi:hypothetical protein